MLLTVLSALFGAFLGLNSRNRFLAALAAAALAGAAHFVLLYASAILLALLSHPAGLTSALAAVGLRGYGVTITMGAGASAALMSGILLGFEQRIGRAPPRVSPELLRIDEVLNR